MPSKKSTTPATRSARAAAVPAESKATASTANLLETPIVPMLAKVADTVPTEGDWLYEPKWDGFRAIVFRRGDQAHIQSRDGKPLDRYFPELQNALAIGLPPHCVIDGEIIIIGADGRLDFDALSRRIHPTTSRVTHMAKRTPASFVAFDLLVAGRKSVMAQPQARRRESLERLLAKAMAPVYLTPVTRDAAEATDWLQRFEGAGLDGVMAKPADGPYLPGKRAMLKIKHQRTADCVVAGFRWHKTTQEGGPPAIGSLLLGLYDDAGVLQHVGITSSFTLAHRRALAEELAPLRDHAADGHPWLGEVAAATADGDEAAAPQRRPGERSRWSGDKDLAWEPLGAERVCEVQYDHLQGDRFRHATTFVRWRGDKPVADCRFDQLEVVGTAALKDVFKK